MSIFSSTILHRYSTVHRAEKSIVLIGMMGAGKSTVGRCLHERTALACFDTDDLVAAEFGLSIREIFTKYGEERFRDAETNVLRKLFLPYTIIVVAGGGIVLREENVDLLKQLGTVVWLDADEDTLFERATRGGDRPLLDTKNPRDQFALLSAERKALYERAADLRIDCSTQDENGVADAILDRMAEVTATR